MGNEQSSPFYPDGPLTIVLDLDEALIHAKEDDINEIMIEIQKPENLDLRKRFITLNFDEKYWEQESDDMMWATKRPYLDEFLNFCFYNFDYVCVWSAGTYDYVHKICEILSMNTPRKFDYILTRDDCEEDYENDTYCKPLEKIFKLDPNITPELTIMVDDRVENFIKNRGNGLVIPKYEPEYLDHHDEYLLHFMDWWNYLMKNGFDDIRNIDFRDVFYV